MRALGINGFVEIVKKCMDNTKYLVKMISEINGIKLAANPVMNIVGITTENGESICEIDEALRNNKWMLGKFVDFNLIRVVLMPHVKRDHISNFTSDLEKVVKKLNL
ncbi:hypothetical protein ES707_21188 [subsurface metagenome]